jgi:hypothetical protein
MSNKENLEIKDMLDYRNMVGPLSGNAKILGDLYDSRSFAFADEPDLQTIARRVMTTLGGLFRFPPNGLFEFSGSQANRKALLLARNARTSSRQRYVLMTNLAHSSLHDACDELGLEPLVMEARPELSWELEEDELRNTVERVADRICAVVSTAGTTLLGKYEGFALHPIIGALADRGAWVHIDAAYGGLLGQGLRPAKFLDPIIDMGIPDFAQSITLDPYKLAGPLGLSVLLLREQLSSKRIAYFERSAYVQTTTFAAGPLAALDYILNDAPICRPEDSVANLAQRNLAAAAYVREHLNVPLLAGNLGIVSVECRAAEHAYTIRELLAKNGFRVGKLHLAGNGYDVDGVRLVMTLREPEIQQKNLDALCDAVRASYSHR